MGFAHSPQTFPHRYVNSVIPQKMQALSNGPEDADFRPVFYELLHLPSPKGFESANLSSENTSPASSPARWLGTQSDLKKGESP